jgi:hypothetical protein
MDVCTYCLNLKTLLVDLLGSHSAVLVQCEKWSLSKFRPLAEREALNQSSIDHKLTIKYNTLKYVSMIQKYNMRVIYA